jgi:hypothetical protein
VLVQLTNLGPRNFPLTGLQQIEPEWQDIVSEIITKPPVNQILKVSSFMLSLTEIIPITSVEKPPIAASA